MYYWYMFYFFSPMNSNWDSKRILCMCHYLFNFQSRYRSDFGNSLVSQCVGEQKTLPEMKIDGLIEKVAHWKKKCANQKDTHTQQRGQERWLLYQPLINKYACHKKCTQKGTFCRTRKKKRRTKKN